ncbi:hypothetical protein BDQ17DRAFT_1218723, partial [Cyathus striatus]
LGTLQKLLKKVAYFAPGCTHNLSPIPTPSSTLEETYIQACQPDFVTFLPRRPEYSVTPSCPSITFSEDGRPGPSIRDLVKGNVYLDNADDAVFEPYGWRRTRFFADWPGVTDKGIHINTRNDRGHALTRAELAYIVASHIGAMIVNTQKGIPLPYGPQHIDDNTRPWSLYDIDYRDVRLIAINYYQNVWIPVLGVNSA